ncbi:MAG: hypothetical protein JWQ41_1557, partial [Variovorax sp.]|nr:hypothetical protein [Variovorax sp.]
MKTLQPGDYAEFLRATLPKQERGV